MNLDPNIKDKNQLQFDKVDKVDEVLSLISKLNTQVLETEKETTVDVLRKAWFNDVLLNIEQLYQLINDAEKINKRDLQTLLTNVNAKICTELDKCRKQHVDCIKPSAVRISIYSIGVGFLGGGILMLILWAMGVVTF